MSARSRECHRCSSCPSGCYTDPQADHHEQAELSGREVDTRTDIYALGVLLYELLTGTTPFDEERLRTVGYDEFRRIIREEEPPRPSTRVSTLGQAATTVSARRESDSKRLSRLFRGDLDWIVMKALKKDRDRRYDTGSALAADVQRYLHDEPVLASPPTLRYRLGKFLRKHRGPVLAASLILVLLLVGIIGTSLGFLRAERLRQIAEENEQTAQQEKTNALASAAAARLAQDNEAAERKKAEAAQRQAMEALRATTDDVVAQLIGAKPALSPAERAFLENTSKRWQIYADQKGDGELARQVRAEGVASVAHLRVMLGEKDAALAGFGEASVLWGKLNADFPAVAEYRQQLGKSHNSRAILLRDLGKDAEAEEAYRQALAIHEKLAAEFPAEPEYRLNLAASHNNRGNLLADLRKGAAAEANYRQALGIYKKLAAEFPDMPRYRQELAASQINWGSLLEGQRKPADAEAAYRQALGLQEKLAADFPEVPQFRSEVARSHNTLGSLLLHRGKPAEAEEAYRQALGLQEKLAADFPAQPQYRQELGRSHNNRGILLAALGKPAKAEEAYRQALAIQEKLAADFPAVPHYRIDLGTSQLNFGYVLANKRQLEPALEWYAKAIATLQGVLRQVENNATARHFLCNAHWRRAVALDLDLKRYAEAMADWDRAVELSAEPGQNELRMRRAACRVRTGRVDSATREAEEVAKNANAVTLFNAACIFALAAARPEDTGGLLSREACAQRAVVLLRQAVAKEAKLAEHIKRDDDLQALRQRDDFKKLLAELEKKSP